MQQQTLIIARLGLLTALTLVVQAGGFPQPLTGPLINMLLLLTAIFVGWKAGIMLGVITPVVAILRGQLPASLAPMMPFIAVGNVLLVACFSVLISWQAVAQRSLIYDWRTYFAIGVAALIKFCWLTASVKMVLPVFLGKHLPSPLVYMMTLPQLITASIGGLLAVLVVELFNRTGYEHRKIEHTGRR